jgi:hypothetical protein
MRASVTNWIDSRYQGPRKRVPARISPPIDTAKQNIKQDDHTEDR